MAIEPFRQRISVPDGGGISSGNIGQLQSVGPQITRLGQEILQAGEPIVKQQALEAAKRAAGEALLERNEKGDLILPQAADGGMVYRAAFDQLMQERYLNQVNLDWQGWLNGEINERRSGVKPFDPAEFETEVQARMDGVLQGVDPAIRNDVEQLVAREALERTRSFRDEWGRNQRAQAISGTQDQMKFLFDALAAAKEEGLTPEEADAKYGKPLTDLTARAEQLGYIGPAEADAVFMKKDRVTSGMVKYAGDMRAIVPLVSRIAGMTAEELRTLEYWTRGIKVDGKLTGLVSYGQADERVTPELLKTAFGELFPGVTASSFERSLDDPLSKANPGSYHSTANGGRAVDVPPIKGMTFAQYVAKWKAAGFEVVESKEEVGANRSPWATGDHWHIAFANTRKVDDLRQEPGLSDLTFEQINRLDPSIKQSLLTVITDRSQVLREEQAQAEAQAREDARFAKEQANQRELINGVNGLNSAGLGGNWNPSQKGALDNAFNASVNLDNLNDPKEQAKVSFFIQQHNYLPGPVINYLDNNVRSPEWQGAVQLYRNIKGATLNNGAIVGDLILGELNPRTRALLSSADEMIASGQSMQAVQLRMEQLRSGNGFTVDEAKGSYGEQIAGDRTRSYAGDRNNAIRQAYGMGSEMAVPPVLARRIDESFAANLDVSDRDPLRALKKAIEQNKGVYQPSSVFWDGAGPSVLLRNYSITQLGNFFGQLRDRNGNRLVPPVRGKSHVIGKGGSIKLVPLDNATSQIGMYEVRLYDPQSPSTPISSFSIDLGAELNRWSQQQASRPPAAARRDPVAEARRERADTARTLRQIGGDPYDPLRGPKM